MKGQQMLKVCSILMIIGGALNLLLAIIVIAGLAVLMAALEGAGAALLVAAMVAACLGGALELAAGIVGVKAAEMPSVGKIKAALILGILVVVLCLFNLITNVVSEGFTTSSIITMLLGVVVPILYLVGLIQYKNALVALLSGE